MNEKIKEIVDSGECPFCHVLWEIHKSSEDSLWCANCNRVVAYCEGIGIYEETDEVC